MASVVKNPFDTEAASDDVASAAPVDATAPSSAVVVDEEQEESTTATSPTNLRHATISNFSPISTLQRQYDLDNKLLMVVKCNPACCGVTLDEVFKMQKERTSNGETDFGGGMADTPVLSADGISPASSTEEEEGGGGTDPFSFLNSGGTASDSEQPKSKKKKKPNLGRFLKKVAATGTQALERGMHQLAVKADQGKSPDHIVMGLYERRSSGSNDGPEEYLLYATEAEPVGSGGGGVGVQFRIPLVVPGSSSTILLKLWIRSGAALVSSKHHLLAESGPLSVSQLRESMQHQQAAFSHSNSTRQRPPLLQFTIPLHSPFIVDGQVSCTVIPDTKFPTVWGRGWSLQDPDQGPASMASQMFHLPLHQSYALELPGHLRSMAKNSASSLLLATERSIESTVVLPLAAAYTTMAARACRRSLDHCVSVRQDILENRHDAAVGSHYAIVHVQVSHLQTNMASSSILQTNRLSNVSASFQRPNSIFEVEVMGHSKLPLHPTAAGSFRPDVSCKFYPKPVPSSGIVLPSFAQRTTTPPPFWLGNVRMVITVPTSNSKRGNTGAGSNSRSDVTVPENPFDPVTHISSPVSSTDEIWDCVIPLDGLESHKKHKAYPIFNASGQNMGDLVLSITVDMVVENPAGTTNNDLVPAAGGLVSLVGLPNSMENIVYPPLDFDYDYSTNTATAMAKAQQQKLQTMGQFVTHAYLDHHVNFGRSADVEALEEKAREYHQALETVTEMTPSYKDRTPRPFRPSSSRLTTLLSGIGFNIHTATFSLEVLENSTGTTNAPPPGALFHNITCGAPANHARGFGNVFTKKEKDSKPTTSVALNSPIGPATGGLRRLEDFRRTLAKDVEDQQTMLIMSIENHFVEQQDKRRQTHVPARHAELQGLRWKVFEAIQCLHHLTWTCALRRASVFSQALGIAVSSYLSSLSDFEKLQSKWPELWARHGFLVSFEGLLSAAGKELGMIEDASVGIDMLKMIRIILVPDDGTVPSHPDRVPVPHSQYLRWIHLWSAPTTSTAPTVANNINSDIEYTLQIGIELSYFSQRVPIALKNGTAVRLCPLLFEVGVDIFQAASNAGSNMSKSIPVGGSKHGSVTSDQDNSNNDTSSDEEDDVANLLTDSDDELVQINYEAFQKMNAYAKAVSPVSSPTIPATTTQQQQQQELTHPMLATLFQHIVSSAGKVNHDILDEAATLAQQLGGGGVVFCKSGKDRTAMHETYKQAQFASRFRKQNNINPADTKVEGLVDDPALDTAAAAATATGSVDSTLNDAYLLRLYGTRLPICEKNVGQAKYAFNSLQVKFMPDALKPPMSALAGFLKGGKVFGGGGIES